MRFTGNIDAKLDDKGRVFLPAIFRKIIQKEGVEGLILRRDVFQKCLVLFPEDIWNSQVDAITSRASYFDRKGREALRMFVAGAENISMDGNGRILIPRRYLEAAGISSEARFIGVDNTIEIWNPQSADALMAENEVLADNLEQLMIDFPASGFSSKE